MIKEELEKIAEDNTAPELLKGSAYELLLTAQEMIAREEMVAIALRPDIGFWKYIIVDPSSMEVHRLETSAYLAFKEKLCEQGTFLTVTPAAMVSSLCASMGILNCNNSFRSCGHSHSHHSNHSHHSHHVVMWLITDHLLLMCLQLQAKMIDGFLKLT